MKNQKLRGLIMLCLLFLLGMVYSAHVFVVDAKATVEIVAADSDDDNAENNEEKVNETFHHLFLHERPLYYLTPMAVVNANFSLLVNKMLPEAYLQLNTPPPDFA